MNKAQKEFLKCLGGLFYGMLVMVSLLNAMFAKDVFSNLLPVFLIIPFPIYHYIKLGKQGESK